MDPSSKTQTTALVGIIIGSHGILGEAQIQPHSDNPDRFTSGSALISNGETLRIESSRQHKGNIIVKFEGINTIEKASDLIGRSLEIPIRSISSLEADNYYHYQIIGLKVWTSDHEYLGDIAEILATGSNDVYIVSNARKDTLIPALKSIIKDVNLKLGYMIVELPDGL